MHGTWKHCNICKKAIPLGARYYVCSVSTCNRQRTGMSFCSVECCDAHAPVMNHREYWAEERRAPTEPEPLETAVPSPRRAADRRLVKAATTPQGHSETATEADEVLVVTSKVKKYVRARSGMNTSDAVARVLSDHIRRLCDQAIDEAERAGRKTVLDRDLPPGRGPRSH